MAIHKLRALEYLVAVVDTGGYTAAARRLGVAAPSVHRLVNALEAEIGLALLEHDAQPLLPTAEGLRYVERARTLLGELQALEASLHDRSSAPQGTLTVAAHSTVMEHMLADVLPRFHDRFPQVRIDLRDAGTQRDLEQLGTDVLMQMGWPPAQAASLRTLVHSRWLVVATPGFWARHGVPQHPSDLAALPCTLFRVPYGEVLRRWVFQRGDERVEVEVDGWLTSDNRVALDAPLLAGQVVSRVSDLTVRSAVHAGTLQPVLLDWVGQSAPPLNLLFRRSLARQPRLRAWVDFLADWAAVQDRERLPAGLPPVAPAQRPEWFKRRVG
jgi:DNA-binding transcriptional LysR family regulator